MFTIFSTSYDDSWTRSVASFRRRAVIVTLMVTCSDKDENSQGPKLFYKRTYIIVHTINFFPLTLTGCSHAVFT